jgi:hypothetical protein
MTKKDMSLGTPGRRKKPPIDEGKKKQPRNLSISNDAWFELTRKIDTLGISSISELNEKIGLSEIRLVVIKGDYNSDLSDTKMYLRLKQFVQQPVAIFLSVLAFAKRTARQLNLSTAEERLVDVVNRAFAITFAHGYLYPDVYINNPSAVVRWLIYHLLVAEADTKTLDRKKSTEIEEAARENCLHRIAYALKALEEAHWASHYQTFNSKAIEGLTLQQVVRIFKLQNEELTEDEVRQKIKEGLAFFRIFWQETGKYTEEGGINLKNIHDIDLIRDYCRIAGQSLLNKPEFRKKIENILVKSIHNSRLDFWINEIDYHLLERECENNDLRVCQREYERLSITIEDGIDEYLLARKKAIDTRLAWCSELSCIEDVFKEEIKTQSGNSFNNIDWRIVIGKHSSELETLEWIYKILEEANDSSVEDAKNTLNELTNRVKKRLESIRLNPFYSE